MSVSPSALWKPEYSEVILATDPIAYWPLDEKVGAVAYEWARRSQGSNQDGIIVGTTLEEPGMGDGRTSQYFDAINDFVNAWTAALAAAFNGGEGTAAIWVRMANAGVWNDVTFRKIFILRVDANNFTLIEKTNVLNQLDYRYRAGGIERSVTSAALAGTLDWFHVAQTWSASAGVNGEFLAYANGTQVGLTQVNLGAWAGLLANAVLGATSTIPTQVTHGWLAHPQIYTRALAPAEIEYLYRKGYECQGRL